MSDELPDYRIPVGRRVECRKQGPHNGKRGVVQGRISHHLVVEFDTTTIVERATCFEPV